MNNYWMKPKRKKKKNWKSYLLLLHWWEATPSPRTLHDNQWPWVSLTWLFYDLKLWRHGCWFENFTSFCPPLYMHMYIAPYCKLFFIFWEGIADPISWQNFVQVSMELCNSEVLGSHYLLYLRTHLWSFAHQGKINSLLKLFTYVISWTP